MSVVAVIGKGADAPSRAMAAAWAAGSAVALEGHVLVTGGLGGCMQAASHAAAEAGGVVIGLIPAAHAPNEWVTIPLRTGLPEPFRNVVLAHAADITLACWGGHGTRQELAHLAERAVPIATVDAAERWPEYPPLSTDVDEIRAWLRTMAS